MHEYWQNWRPDQIAECVSGVSPNLYKELWGLTSLWTKNPMYNAETEQGEYPGESWPECQLVKHWDNLSDDAKRELNELGEREWKENIQ